MAEGLFIHLLKERGLQDRYEVDSAGTAGYHIGSKPDERMISTARSHGVELPSRARQFVSSDFDEFDFIVAMDQSNLRNILAVSESNQYRAKVLKMRDFDTVDEGGDVPDPYYGGMNGFEEVYNMLLDCNQNFLDHLENAHE